MKKSKILLFSLLLLTSCNGDSSHETPSISKGTTSEQSSEVTSSNIDNDGYVQKFQRVEAVDKFLPPKGENSFDAVINIDCAKSENGKISPSTSSSYYGNKEYITAVPDYGYHIGYLLKNNMFFSNEEESYFYVNLSNQFYCHFTKDNYYSVLFLQADGTYIKNVDVLKGERIDMYSYSHIPGYDLAYNIDISNLDSVSRDLVIIPHYVKHGIPNIEITRCTYEQKDYHYGDSITFTADKESNLFEYFNVNGELYSSNSKMQINIYDDVKVEAIYGDSFVLNSPKVSLNPTAICANNHILINGFSAPFDRLTQVENGIIIKENTHDEYHNSQVFVARGIDELGNFNVSFPTDIDYDQKYIQTYAVYRHLIDDEYIYAVYVSDLYQIV